MKNTIYFRSQAGKKAAFTQVELLVLVVVIGVLGMMGLAGSAKLSNQTKIAQCSNNLRQLNLAQLMYAADNSDNLPNNNNAGFWPWDMSGSVATSLLQYGLVPKTMYCPGTAPRFTDEQNWAGAQSLWNYGGGAFHVIGYAMTIGGVVAATNLNSTILPRPMNVGPAIVPPTPAAQRVLTADGNLSAGGNFTAVFGGFTYNGVSYPHTCPHLDGAYPAGGNVGMLDGHVEWRAFKDMKIRTGPGAAGAPLFYW